MKKIFTIVALTTMAIALNAQNVTRTMEFEGTTRKYIEHIPASPNGSMPVLFQLHGLGDNCNDFSQLGFETLAPNWIIITPEATEASIMGQPAGTAWAAGVGGENIPYINSIELNADVNDEGFILAILDSLENNFDIDTDSIFVTGFSMGGFMSNKMAVKHADRITAIASVSGTLGHFQAFEPTGKINTMHIHGTSDETISYADASFSYSGFSIQVGLGAEALVEIWRNYNECGTEPIVYNFEDTKNDGLTFVQYTYKNTETGNKTVFIKVNNGVHTWYEGSSNDIDYTTEIYKFFIGEENGTTKIEETISDAIAIYPNPATDIVNIVSQNDSELSIYNATGKEIKRISTTQSNTTIDISDLPNGIYFVVVDGCAKKLTIAR